MGDGACTEAVDTLHAMAGANGIYDRYPIQRLFRDQHALSAHIGFSWDAQGGSWALVAMGGRVREPDDVVFRWARVGMGGLWVLIAGMMELGGYLVSKLLDPGVSTRAKLRVMLFVVVLVALAVVALTGPTDR